ncbi:hypothetical protein ABIC24_003218 [Methylobacterium radiotolerans]
MGQRRGRLVHDSGLGPDRAGHLPGGDQRRDHRILEGRVGGGGEPRPPLGPGSHGLTAQLLEGVGPVGEARGQQRQQGVERGADVAHRRQAGGVGAPEVAHVGRELEHLHPRRHRRDLRVEHGDQRLAAQREHRVVAPEDVGDGVGTGRQVPGPERVRGGERDVGRPGRAVDRRRQQVGERDHLRRGVRGVDLVARDQGEAARRDRGESLRQPVEGARHRPLVDGRGLAGRHRRQRLHHVHGQGQEDRAGGGGPRVVEGPAQQDRDLVGARHLAGPLHHRVGDGDEVAHQQRVGQRVAEILLPGGDHQRRAGDLGIHQPAHGVAEAARRVQVEEGGAPRALRVAVRHGDRGRLLQGEDVGDVGRLGERVDERQLGGAGIAEDVAHALRAQHLHQEVGAPAAAGGLHGLDRHALSSPGESAGGYPMGGPGQCRRRPAPGGNRSAAFSA